MKFYSTRNHQDVQSLSYAILNGLAPDGGLYVPVELPKITTEMLSAWRGLNYLELTQELAQLWFSKEVDEQSLKKMVQQAYKDLSPQIKKLSDSLSVLELFHGPTLSFKDFGARMLAQLMNHFSQEDGQKRTILAATSGDTGVAVASAFSGLENIQVVILYPKGKVSPFQEQQMLSLEGNVHVYAVDGTFDDCQQNVKQAFNDQSINNVHLTSANSINIGRLIPQSWYYVYAALQTNSKAVFSIPSGNFGNLTACLMAQLQGVPIKKIIAATNINDVIPEYLQTGVFTPRPSVLTVANSMDIGNPSNWERIQHYLGTDLTEVKKYLWGAHYDDQSILENIKSIDQNHKYIVDPHGAIAFKALLDFQKQQEDSEGIAVMTGSPYKYRPLLEEVTQKKFSDWPRLDASQAEPVTVSSDYSTLKNLLKEL